MKFGIFDKFGAKNSVEIFEAFRSGLDRLGWQHVNHDITADVAVIWSVLWSGRMADNLPIWQKFRSTGRAVIIMEVGMLLRQRTWRMSLNGVGSHGFYGTGLDIGRPQKLGLSLKPWKQTGDRIVVCGQRTEGLQWQGQPPTERWLADLHHRLRLHTQKPLIWRPHPRQKLSGPVPGYHIEHPTHLTGSYDDFDFDHSLEDAWAVINHNSGPGSQAVMSGMPAFVDSSSLAAPVANQDLSLIETPAMPDRGHWFLEICHTEWTPEEISTGWPIQRLFVGRQAL